MPGKTVAAWVTCPTCNKRAYHSKGGARSVKRRLPGHLSAYRCPSGTGWHLGHLPTMVLRGIAGRDQLNRRGVA